ncbi:MAG: ImmA/IrrE family metallo-endopeptidase [Bacteroidales bacterium]|nr:ImmA/IrrE family metallo-endopeptidase [Bacteroidales bacterium]
MNKLSITQAEELSYKLRNMAGFSDKEPINMKTFIMKLGILLLYKPMGSNSCGMSLMSADRQYKFILINSKNSKGRQHFTIGHELYHLYYDEKPEPHVCKLYEQNKNISEYNADIFSSALLMPQKSIIENIPDTEIIKKDISMATLLKLQHLFSVSFQALVIRLKHLKMITENQLQQFLGLPITDIAKEYGYNTSLYKRGNENLMIGNFGEKAKILFDKEKISEGHYTELLNMINNE